MVYNQLFENEKHLKINDRYLEEDVDSIQIDMKSIPLRPNRFSQFPILLDNIRIVELSYNVHELAALYIKNSDPNILIHYICKSSQLPDIWDCLNLNDKQRIYIIQYLCAASDVEMLSKLLFIPKLNVKYLKKLIYINPQFAYELAYWYLSELDENTRKFVLYSCSASQLSDAINNGKIFQLANSEEIIKRIYHFNLSEIDELLSLINITDNKYKLFQQVQELLIKIIDSLYEKIILIKNYTQNNLLFASILILRLSPKLLNDKTDKIVAKIFNEDFNTFVQLQCKRIDCYYNNPIQLHIRYQPLFIKHFYHYYAGIMLKKTDDVTHKLYFINHEILNYVKKMLNNENYEQLLESIKPLQTLYKLI